ncbi:hypothetical protein BC830DRAFT_1077322 [Chytriomyces sp. MP71]|nr:hypothetical protein BC830DRAFT_1077322 [Chytriomyces sp. MP71]
MTGFSKIDDLMRELDLTLDEYGANEVLDDYFGNDSAVPATVEPTAVTPPQMKVPRGPPNRNSYLTFINAENTNSTSYYAFGETNKALPIPPVSPSTSVPPGSPVHELFLKQQQQLLLQQQLIFQQQQQMQTLEQQAHLAHSKLYLTTAPERLSLKTPISTTMVSPITSIPDLARSPSQSASPGPVNTPDLVRAPSQSQSSPGRIQDSGAMRRQSIVSQGSGLLLGSGLGISGGGVFGRGGGGESVSFRTSPEPATGGGLSALFGFRGKAGSPTQRKGAESFAEGLASAGLF